jgi:uncharacterized protein (TIGR02598 family)
MKLFHFKSRRKIRAFSLVESALSVGILSFGFLSVVPLVDLGLNSAREARAHRATAQIAEMLMDQARQGTLVAGSAYFDNQETACPSPVGAAYRAQTTLATAVATTGLTRLTVQVTPLATPNRSQFYAVMFPPP